jgi:ribosomal protein S18 acetylase RimI-like enzyme
VNTKAGNLNIIEAGIAHIPLIQAMTQEVWPSTYVPIIGEEQVAYMLALFYTDEALILQMNVGHRFIIGYDEALPVAFASFSEIEEGIYKLHKLYIMPSVQGRGVGRAMLAYIVATINAERSKAQLRLNVNIHNTGAIAFYTKSGFLHLHDEDIDIGNDYFMNDHVLYLPLATR